TPSTIGTTTPAADTQSSQRAGVRSTWGAIARPVMAATVSTPAPRNTGPTTVRSPEPVAIPAAVIGTPRTTSTVAIAANVARRPRSRTARIASAAIRVAANPA